MAHARKQYTPKFKFQLVVEILNWAETQPNDQLDAAIARAYGVHPVTRGRVPAASKWKTQFMEKGPEVFSGKEVGPGLGPMHGLRAPHR